jgi:hypothetical protein
MYEKEQIELLIELIAMTMADGDETINLGDIEGCAPQIFEAACRLREKQMNAATGTNDYTS